MDVRGILKRKGDTVATVKPGATIGDALRQLAEMGVGALVVSADGERVAGIISERDIVRALAKDGPDGISTDVASVCTTTVKTCSLDDTVDELMKVMTDGRFRHCPVVENGVLAGIISIGDVVRFRVDELEGLTKDLEAYVSGTW